MFLWCVRDGWTQGQTAILTQPLLCCVIFKNPLSTSSASWLGLLNRGSLRATAPSGAFSVCKLLSLWPSCTNWLNGRRHLPILFHNVHLLLLLLLLIYTGTSLIDGSVKDQYITLRLFYHHQPFINWIIINGFDSHRVPCISSLVPNKAKLNKWYRFVLTFVFEFEKKILFLG